MAKTLKEIATSVLKKLGRLPEGQTANPGHLKTVTDEYEGLYDELLGESLVNWSEGDDIPGFAENPIKMLLLSRTADNFGVPNQWFQLENIERMKLAKGLASPYVDQPTPYSYF
jgi:hypothetical protein